MKLQLNKNSNEMKKETLNIRNSLVSLKNLNSNGENSDLKGLHEYLYSAYDNDDKEKIRKSTILTKKDKSSIIEPKNNIIKN